MNEALELTDKGNKDMQVGVKETVPMVKLKKDKVQNFFSPAIKKITKLRSSWPDPS